MTETTVTERWTYLGRRYWSDRGLVHVWEKPDGKEAVFKKFPATAIGGIYDVETVLGGTSVRGAPTFTGDVIDEDRRAVLTAADAAAWQQKALVDAEKRYAKSTDLDRALEPLEYLASKCRSVAEVEALQQVVRARIAKARWKS